MTIRPGAVEDIPAVILLTAKTIAFHEQLDPARFGAAPHAAERYEPWLQRLAGSDSGVFLVAEQQGVIVGFLLAQIQEEYKIYRTGRYGMIHDMWVEPEQRRKGIAKAMVLSVLERFRAAGVEQARLDTAFANHPSQQLFAGAGFRPSVVEMLAEL